MTSDVRQLLRAAAETDAPDFGGARAAMQRGVRLRWLRRVQVAVPAALAIAVVVALIGPQLPGIGGDAQRISPARPGHDRRAPEPTPVHKERDRDSSEPDRSDEREPGAATQPRDERGGPSAPHAPRQVAAGCSPLIEDFSGDVDNASIDILESSISYDRATNTLVFGHILDDIEREPAGEMHYDLHFTWDELLYSAEVWTDQTGQEHYAIVRPRRENGQGVPSAVDWVDLGTPTGRIDTVNDTVTLRVSLDEFNEGEKVASASEGHPPPEELKVGSKLTAIDLRTLSGPFGSSHSDYGYTECDYVVAP